MREAATGNHAAALGFISAIGAIGGFFIPKAFGTSLALTGSPAGAMKVFLVFYVACVVITGRYMDVKTINAATVDYPCAVTSRAFLFLN